MTRVSSSTAEPAEQQARPETQDSDHKRSSVSKQQPEQTVIRGILQRLQGLRRRWMQRVDQTAVHWAARSRFGSRLYYALFCPEFGREQQAVLSGRVRYAEDLQNPRRTSALLRRNVHGLEKGILMRPRRSRFAAEYIGVTIDCYEKLLQAASSTQEGMEELEWAHDVLRLYFEITDDHPPIADARRRFEAISTPTRHHERVLVPYCRDLTDEPPVRYEDLLRLAERRRSVRWFLQNPVDRDLIDKAMSVARQCPSACNRQPFHFLVLDDRTLAQRVASISMGTAGYWDNIPVLIAVVGKQRSYFSERDRHLIYIDGALASMALVFALESLGLATCCINWPDVEAKEREVAEVLGLESDERVTMLMAVGYPDPEGLVAYSQKKPLVEFRRYNFE